MRYRAAFTATILLASFTALRADVSVTTRTEFVLNPALQALMEKAPPAAMAALAPQISTLQIKGPLALSTSAYVSSLVDMVKKQATLLVASNKTYATLNVGDLLAQMTQAMQGQIGAAAGQAGASGLDLKNVPPEAQQFINGIKVTYTSQKTGQTDTIQGIQVEDTQINLTVLITMPDSSPMAGTTIPAIRITGHLWYAAAPEMTRVPALGELQQATGYMVYSMSPLSMFKTLLTSLPSNLSGGFGDFVNDLTSAKTPLLKFHFGLASPLVGLLAQLSPGTLPPGFDPSQSLIEMNYSVTSLSADPIDATVFQIPADYKAVPAPDLFKAMAAAAKSAGAAGAGH